MKKLILILFVALASLTASAKAPVLHVEKMFDGSYNSDPDVTIIITRSQDQLFRGCTVNNNEALVKKITQLFDQDLKNATTSKEIYSSGSRFRSMTIINDGYEIYVGLSYNTDNGCYLFIKAEPEAFK